MSDDGGLKVVLCWHMHQPDYRGPDHGDYELPWVYLHAVKDYLDMAAHLEQSPDARAVVNFAPVLLEQIDDYVRQIDDWLQRGKLIRDPFLAALAGPGLPLDGGQRLRLMRDCRRANEKHLINRFPSFRRLVELATMVDDDEQSVIYLNDQYLADLLVWYHLAWMGEYARANDLRIAALEKKRRGYDADDRRRLVTAIGDIMASVVGRYRRLADAGRIELSVTPYTHPILPLMIDLDSAKEAMPEIVMPESADYPGGESRARWHIRKGIEVFERYFGSRPTGCWPSEGSISSDTLRLLEEEGFSWAASGQQVLQNSLTASTNDQELAADWAHTAYCLGEGSLNLFFRDDGLSDLIGFTYADWHGDDAVNNLVQHLETIALANQDRRDRVVSIIMDGENAWEYYPRNGSYFLSALYQRLASNPDFCLTTFSDVIARRRTPPPMLDRLVAGSWVYGTFSTWLGDPDKNRAWDMLVEAKQVYDRVLDENRLDNEAREQASLQLARCEGSDWFWWFGEYNPGATVSEFERLFRLHLTYLYKILGEPPPDYLSRVFAIGSGDPAMGGVMRQNV